MKKNTIIIMCLLLSIYTKAQVTIGGKIDPESYSLVQIEGADGGMMLPRLTATQMNTLAATPSFTSNPKAKGLFAYNTEQSSMVYWNGQRWIYVNNSGMQQADNGLGISQNTLELGGNLTQNTGIDQKNFPVTFQTTGSSSVLVNNSNLMVNSNEVSMKPSDAITINDKHSIFDDKVNFQPQSLLIYHKDATGDNVNDLVLDKNGLRLTDTYLNFPAGQHSSDMLTIDPITKALSWQPLRPFNISTERMINGPREINIPGGVVTVATDTMTLARGQYLIFGSINTEMTVTNANNILYNWVGIQYKPARSTSTPVTSRINGVLPEIKGQGETSYATVRFRYYLNLTEETEIWAYVISSNEDTNYRPARVNNYISPNIGTHKALAGEPFFYAVRLDVPHYQ